MFLGCIADDFTGAGDLANNLNLGGMSVLLYAGMPDTLAALEWLRAQGAKQILFKYCSTFDSTPQGNIGPVAEALMAAIGTKKTIFCPALPETGRSVYMGHLFTGDRLLNESGMENHPLTPMLDADIRRWLQQQVKGKVGHLPANAIRTGNIVDHLAAEVQANRGLIVCDTLDNDDLNRIGAAVADWPLITGGSGIGLGIATAFRDQNGGNRARMPEMHHEDGPAVVLSGSCSKMSNAQVAHALGVMPGLAVYITALMEGRLTVADGLAFATHHGKNAKLIYSTAGPSAIEAAQRQYGQDVVAARVETFFAELARALVDAGHRRLVVGGGETSGAVVQALNPGCLLVGQQIDLGIPALTTTSGLKLALKSGNFGGVDFYERALKVLESS